jgi:hypothetical protein
MDRTRTADRRPGTGRRVTARRVVLALSLATAVAAGLTVAGPAEASAPSAAKAAAPAAAAAAPVHRSCGTAAPGRMRCFSRWQRTAATTAAARTAGLVAPPAPPADAIGAKDVAAAYGLVPGTGAVRTVAIVDAFDNPNVEKDLAVYRSAFGLTPCTTANGCFRKVNQRGGAKPPQSDAGWGVEIALDVQAVSASCPMCKVLLVEADDNSFDSLGAAVNTAVRLGAKVVSNSYGGDEFNGAIALGKKFYVHPGVAQVVSSGDFGFTTAQVPAAYTQVVAAGGTTLTRTPAGGYTEQAWFGAGSGCSAWIAKPAWQKDTHCLMRTTSDVSAVADNYAVYDTFGLGPDNGWIVVGGTSISSPLLAGMIGRAGKTARLDSAQYIYAHRAGLHDVVGGSNGFCGGDYLCVGKKGYDGPTGLGSPRGLSSL